MTKMSGRIAPKERGQLAEVHGQLLRGDALRRALGYGSVRTFYRAAIGHATPVPVFKIAGRTEWYAKTGDVEQWLDSLGVNEPKAAKGSSEGVV